MDKDVFSALPDYSNYLSFFGPYIPNQCARGIPKDGIISWIQKILKDVIAVDLPGVIAAGISFCFKNVVILSLGPIGREFFVWAEHLGQCSGGEKELCFEQTPAPAVPPRYDRGGSGRRRASRWRDLGGIAEARRGAPVSVNYARTSEDRAYSGDMHGPGRGRASAERGGKQSG